MLSDHLYSTLYVDVKSILWVRGVYQQLRKYASIQIESHSFAWEVSFDSSTPIYMGICVWTLCHCEMVLNTYQMTTMLLQ